MVVMRIYHSYEAVLAIMMNMMIMMMMSVGYELDVTVIFVDMEDTDPYRYSFDFADFLTLDWWIFRGVQNYKITQKFVAIKLFTLYIY